MTIRKLNKTDFNSFCDLLTVFSEVFEMDNFELPSTNYLETILFKEDIIVFVEMDREKIVGGLTAYVLNQCYCEKPMLYIYDLAIISSYQRQKD